MNESMRRTAEQITEEAKTAWNKEIGAIKELCTNKGREDLVTECMYKILNRATERHEIAQLEQKQSIGETTFIGKNGGTVDIQRKLDHLYQKTAMEDMFEGQDPDPDLVKQQVTTMIEDALTKNNISALDVLVWGK